MGLSNFFIFLSDFLKMILQEQTSVSEFGRGQCQQVCEEIKCGNHCRGACGWSKRYNKCVRGGFTQTREENMGTC